MSPEEIQEHGTPCLELMEAFVQAAAAGKNHSVLLDALLTLYVLTAETHSCSTETAAQACRAATERLEKAASNRPSGAHLH